MKYQRICVLRSKAASLIHKIVSATCGKNIRILDTETDIWITRISVAARILSLSYIALHVKDIWNFLLNFLRYIMPFCKHTYCNCCLEYWIWTLLLTNITTIITQMQLKHFWAMIKANQGRALHLPGWMGCRSNPRYACATGTTGWPLG